MNLKFTNILLLAGVLLQNLSAQFIDNISQKQYFKYFPMAFDMGKVYPNTNSVIILPTNESDSTIQAEMNEFYKSEFVDKLYTIPPDTLIIITDKEALTRDLSNTNIYAFGTKDGNLWTSWFLNKSKTFPIKIEDDSIVADIVYYGNEHVVNSLWFNPYNPKHVLFFHIPQQRGFTKNCITHSPGQIAIWKNKKNICKNPYYRLENNTWVFDRIIDTTLSQYIESEEIGKERYKFDRIGPHFYKYPQYNQVKNCLINDTDIQVDTIKLFDSGCNMNYISDFEWIRKIAKDNKIIALGEQVHHLKQNTYLLSRLLLAVNTFDTYPVLICELPYSYAAYFNYYLYAKDDKEANIFRDSVLYNLFPVFITTLDCIREWNNLNSGKLIEIGCSDLEHDLKKTYSFILVPYFKKIEPNFNFQLKDDLSNYSELFAAIDKLIGIAKDRNIIGDFPFLTPEYIECVVDNFKSTILINLNSTESEYPIERYKVMIRNVTDDKFLGELIKNNKCLFYGGSNHFQTRCSNGDRKTYEYSDKTEGYYLANTFEPTRGKVFSIKLHPLAFYIEDSVKRIDPRLGFELEDNLIHLYKEGMIKLHEPVITPILLYEQDKYLCKLSYQYPGYAFRISHIDEQNILNRYFGLNRLHLFLDLREITQNCVNTEIIIPMSCIGDH